MSDLLGLLRDLRLFFRRTPATPLRTLGILALNLLHRRRFGRRMPRERVEALASFLDAAGHLNAICDSKVADLTGFESARRTLEAAGLGPCLSAYRRRLDAVERSRPRAGIDEFDEICTYRESVAWLALATTASIALYGDCTTAPIDSMHDDPDVTVLFRMLMLCQIIDDVMDFDEDVSADLPSLLTTRSGLQEALPDVSAAIRGYARGPVHRRRPLWLFQLALPVFAAGARLVVDVAPMWLQQVPHVRPR